MKLSSEEWQISILKIEFFHVHLISNILVDEDLQPAVQCLVNNFDRREAFRPREYQCDSSVTIYTQTIITGFGSHVFT
jgi:3-dehydroquinate dehydratase